MKTQGRKNVHGKGGVRSKAAYTASKDKAMLRNVVSQLIVSEKVVVTATVAKQLTALADRMVTYAKKGDVAARRQAAKFVRDIWLMKLKQQQLYKSFSTLLAHVIKTETVVTQEF